jgi:long-chain acyl-CoA synthetase
MKELEGYENLNDLREQGKKALEEGFEDYKTVPIDENAVTILLFTSGTTSMSKAVMLSQQNILSNVKAMEATENFIPGDINMAFLPYHHTFGSVGQTVMLARGVATAYCDGLKYLQKNLVEYKVSVFFCVPLLIESIYKKVMQTVKKQGKEKTLATGIKISQFLLKFGIDIRRKLFKEILDQLGGNLRLVISGAAAIDPEAIKGFNNLGISAVQGFGMTEASPVISAENEKEHALGSCGHAMLGVDLRIDNPDENGVGELIAKGPNIMAGYYENEEETAKTLVDGWLHTGDLAYADDKGYVYICGRKKNVIVLKNGKNVYPEEIEVMISNLDYVEECMVFGQPRKADDPIDLAVCLKVVYNPNVMKETYGATTLEEVEKVVREDVDKINDTMPTYKQITKIIVTDEEMIKTTTGKVKRFEETKKL